MSKCNDPEIANLLHAYELDILNGEDRKKVEIHLPDYKDVADIHAVLKSKKSDLMSV